MFSGVAFDCVSSRSEYVYTGAAKKLNAHITDLACLMRLREQYRLQIVGRLA